MDFETLLDMNCFHDHVNYFYDDRRIAEQRVPKITRQLSAARLLTLTGDRLAKGKQPDADKESPAEAGLRVVREKTHTCNTY
jgi:hypothetical protein